jgi:hypothetical protein
MMANERLDPDIEFDEPTCVICGCTEYHACPGGCSWTVLDDLTGRGLCSACAEKAAAGTER